MRKVTASLTVLIVFAAILSAAAAESAKSLYNKGVKAEAREDYEAAFEYYKAAYQAKPQELKYRVPFERMRFLAAASKVKRGQKLRDQGNLQDALTLFQQAIEVDPSNDLAAQEIRRTQEMMRKPPAGSGQTGTTPPPRAEEDPLMQRLENSSGPVALAQIPDVPLSALEMTDDSKVLYETIGKLANINVLFDPDYTSRPLTIKLQKVNLQEALDIVALESRTFWRPVTPNTIFVAQDTQAKRRELEQNVVKTFYLGNVSTPTDLQDIVNAIRTVLEVQRIQQIPSQNAIVIKGTPDQLALASKMIDDIDKSKPEVIVDVVVAQVRRDKLHNLGITPPQNATVALQSANTTTTTPGGTTTTTTSSGPSLNFNDLQHLNSTNYAVTIDPVKAVALFSDADTKIMQSPRIRATDNEKATLTIADKIPIATGSFGTPLGVGTAVGAVGVNTQFTYTDVGVKMEITPRVHPDGQVTLKLSMEISNLNGSETIGGITQPIISTRKAEQTIRLADGEMNLLGGILEVQDTKTTGGTPILGEIPILKYIFSSTQKEHITNELVFLLVPHIVRGQELNELNRRAYDVGTGSGIDLRIAAKPAEPNPTAPAVASAGTAQPQPQQQQAVAPVTPNRQPAPQAQPPAQSAQPQLGPQAPPQPAQQQQTATPANQPSTPQTAKPGQVSLTLDPGSLTPQQGSNFNVTVKLAHGQDISAVPIQITYDPKTIQFNSVTNGDFLAKDGQQVILVHRDDPSAGKLQITAQRPPGTPGISGDGAVFNLVFTAKAKGNSNITISFPGARNSQNQQLEVLGSQASVTVN
ncbi:MAG TPA: cohesin domain-containing protein [Candidatus Angelobacter sp.]|nr:cohesin domain-containing protein [Candidatus Angelobacter sp.]